MRRTSIQKPDPHSFDLMKILFPSRINPEIDWDTVNRLVNENNDFKDFLGLITEDCKLGKVKSQYDKVMDDLDLAKHIAEKGIKEEK